MNCIEAQKKNYINNFLFIKSMIETIIDKLAEVITDDFYSNYDIEKEYRIKTFGIEFTVNNYLYECCFNSGLIELIRSLNTVTKQTIDYYFNIKDISNKDNTINILIPYWNDDLNSYYTFVSFFDSMCRVETSYYLYLECSHEREHKYDKILNTSLVLNYHLSKFLNWFDEQVYIPF